MADVHLAAGSLLGLETESLEVKFGSVNRKLHINHNDRSVWRKGGCNLERSNFFSQRKHCQLNRLSKMVFAIINSVIGCVILIPCSFLCSSSEKVQLMQSLYSHQ